ncbi:MAG: hypothetical protein ACFFDX_07415 [Candidatus Odinarchaeota archaeon]
MSVLKKDLKLEKLFNATDNLIEQQFYLRGRDTIIGRTPEVSLKIRNSGLIVKKFKDLFIKNIHLFLEQKYLKFFNPFKDIKGLDENHLLEIYQEIQLRLTALHGTKFDDVIRYTIVLSVLISSIRNISFNDCIEEIIKRAKQKSNNMNHNQIQIELDKLFMKNNKNVSILYNISYLDALAESFNFNKVARTCKIQKGKYINRIVNLILDSKH